MAARTNVHVLENDFFEIDAIEFAGATLWIDLALFVVQRKTGHIESARNGMNDFRWIWKDNYGRRLMPEDALGRHVAIIAFLRRRASEAPNPRRVIVTHHRPVRTGASNDPIEAASSSLDDLILTMGAPVWNSGDVHEPDDQSWDRPG